MSALVYTTANDSPTEAPMRSMTHDETRAFLLAGTRTAKLATVRADGRPHVAPIWFTLAGDAIVFTTWHTTVKAANLRRDRRVSLCVDDEQPPFAFVIIEGTAQIIDDDLPALRHWATQIAARYMGADLAEQYGARNGVPGELLIRVTPTRIVAKDGIAD
jgi:PPOX class probable F420-dependent enzyme